VHVKTSISLLISLWCQPPSTACYIFKRYFYSFCHTWEKCFIDISKLTPLFSLKLFSTVMHPKLNNNLIAGALRIPYCLSRCRVPLSLYVHVLYFSCYIKPIIQGRKPHLPSSGNFTDVQRSPLCSSLCLLTLTYLIQKKWEKCSQTFDWLGDKDMLEIWIDPRTAARMLSKQKKKKKDENTWYVLCWLVLCTLSPETSTFPIQSTAKKEDQKNIQTGYLALVFQRTLPLSSSV